MISLTNFEIKIYLEVCFRSKIHSEHVAHCIEKLRT